MEGPARLGNFWDLKWMRGSLLRLQLPESDTPGSESQWQTYVNLQNYLTSVSLSLLICKMGIILNSSQRWYKDYVCQSTKKACSSCPLVIITKESWGHCESQEDVAGDIALEHSFIYFSLSIFRGNKVISSRASDVKIQSVLCETTSFVWCSGGSVCCFEGWHVYGSAGP